ncbi:methionine biosynthesis protein MetW [Aquibaculum arenosum]|uniref:Methionine biosynthesis protein MetW n=1 Tax=Aquibaculum arenosum TaxID=3032591 RepID=A0ABT5YLS1_9PROT|nr:methionine biosynthesis protein MetW [Fodinicurvata sp. CAU 1616]MDF2095885.1 methionine biosynthesis protein MetW [Fodinicurvata sp. CAU 1616]
MSRAQPLSTPTAGSLGRSDLRLIAELIEPGSRVLDIGCGDGLLLEFLVREKSVVGRGMELSQTGVNASVARGLSVVQGDADTALSHYPDGAFDVAVLSKTLQATRDPRAVLRQLVRIGRRAIVSFPNFGYWRIRLSLLLHGRMPQTPSLPEAWYETENIHLCTLLDFLSLCREEGIAVDHAFTVRDDGTPKEITSPTLANLLGQDGVFLLRRD